MIVVALVAAAPSIYLLGILAAAATVRRDAPAPVPEGGGPRFVVIVPAHDEEAGIAATVESLRAAGCTPSVVADNCSDATADRARAAGAEVWERHEPDRRGKGEALAWAFDRLPEGTGAVAVVDADCVVSPNLLEALGARLAAGARAVQASYVVANPDESTSAAARFAGFALINHVRPLGKSALGLSCGLLGSGMAFDRPLLREVPWTAFEVTEDSGYHLRLVEAGVRVEFAPEASVASAMPTTLEAAESQRERWEAGAWQLARSRVPELVATGLRERDPNCLHAGIELLVPPQSLIMAANGAVAILATAARAHAARRIATAALAGQVVFVLAGLRVANAPPSVYRALATAPLLAARNAGLYTRLARGWRPSGWVRTRRAARER